ncbi:MAG: hypothetical protein LBD04_04590 [Synergistaceae bacterium]|jgi:hypothetical protein|nr:hypothetical protein [Synergistaceae bacterium]
MSTTNADKYLAHRYEGELPDLPMPDEPFVREWEAWLNNPEGSDVPPTVKNTFFLSGDADFWLERTFAGRVPVGYARSRDGFKRLVNALYPGAGEIPASVNAFTIKSKRPELEGHRVMLLGRAGYSALPAGDVKIPEEEWLEKSMTIRLNHEACHYFSLRAMGGMRNHALDEIAADCAGQLAAFGTFNAALQRRFFGIADGKILSGGRFSFYVKTLDENAVSMVLEETDAALSTLERYLLANPDMTLKSNRPRLLMKLLSAGIQEIRELQ